MKLIGNLSACDTDMQQPQAQGAEMESLNRLTALLLPHPVTVLGHLKREQINLFGTCVVQSPQWRLISCTKQMFVCLYKVDLFKTLKIWQLGQQPEASNGGALPL